MSWSNIVILISIALATLGLYREYRRALKRFLVLRMIALLIAVIALACLVLPLTYMAGSSQTSYRHVLLTEGFEKDSLQKADSLYTLDAAVHQQYPKAKLISDVSEMPESTHVLGYGLNKAELDDLDSTNIFFHPSPIPDGIIAANWTDQLKTGEPFSVQLKYKNSSSKSYKLILKGLNTTLDSAIIPANVETNITLQTKAKTIGKVIYTLLTINGKDTLQQEHLPVTIAALKPLKVLMLSASPNFETKFLKTWLSENGYGVASRSAITKGKFSQEYINLPKADLTHLSASLLNQFDVLIGDQSLLQSLPASESAALQQAVSQRGMGVIIRADSATKASSWLLRDFAVTHTLGKQAAPVALHLQNKTKTGKLTIAPSYINKNNIQALVSDEQQHLLAAADIIGAGKLVFSTVNNIYNWQLSGNKTDYSALWSLLISKAARKETSVVNWQVNGEMPSVGNAANLVLENTGSINNLVANQHEVHPQQDAVSLFKTWVTYWPAATGWQQISLNNGAPYWWYAWDKNDWKSLTAARKLNATIQYAKSHQHNTISTQQILHKSPQPMPKIYFFMLFLMAATFLWAERKFFNT